MNTSDIGRLTRAPEVKSTANGKQFVKFGLAVKSSEYVEGEDDTDFHDCISWNPRVVSFISQYIGQGDLIFFVGDHRNRKYVKDGVERTQSQITIQTVKPAAKKGDGGGSGNNTPSVGGNRNGARRPAPAPTSDDDFDDEDPFADD